MTEWIKTRRDRGVARIVIDRPEAMNALNEAMVEDIIRHIQIFEVDDEVRSIVIAGAGGKAFVAGADISQFQAATPSAAERLALRTKQMHDALDECRKPVIAAINGHCLGAGLELALACHIRVASTTAKFGLPEIKLGIIPGGGGTVRLSRLVGASVARALTLTGDTIGAERALAAGLVHSVHEPNTLDEAAASIAAKVAAYSPYALSQLKSALNAAGGVDLENAYMSEIKCFALCFSSEDQKEGARAFLEKRTPRFSGR
jgi:enoyl-CoA hydratase/carnithine racemase